MVKWGDLYFEDLFAVYSSLAQTAGSFVGAKDIERMARGLIIPR